MNSKDSLTTGRDDDIQATELNTTQTVGRRGTLRSTISWPAPIPIPKMTKETTHPAGSETISPIGQANANPKEPARANQSRLTPGFLMAIHWNDETTAPIRAPSRTYIQIPGSDSHPLAVAPTIDQPMTIATRYPIANWMAEEPRRSDARGVLDRVRSTFLSRPLSPNPPREGVWLAS